MSHYKHLSISEREMILVLSIRNESLQNIAKIIGRSASTISRELNRNREKDSLYSAATAQRIYEKRRTKCKRKTLLSNEKLRTLVKRLFLEEQWSPEEISKRLLHEKNTFSISYATIYRGIYAGLFNEPNLSHGNRGAIRKLRHRGKTRRKKGAMENRGKIIISNRIDERPLEADRREKTGSSCLVTLTDM